MGRSSPTLAQRIGKLIEPLISQSAADGALPTLFAATSPQAKPAGYYGLRDLMELKGPVSEAKIGDEARDNAVATRLWQVSERLTSSTWPERVVP